MFMDAAMGVIYIFILLIICDLLSSIFLYLSSSY